MRAWFRRTDESQHRALGRETLERELARVGGGPELIATLVRELRADSAEDLQRRIGAGDISATALGQALSRLQAAAPTLLPTRKPVGRTPGRSPVEVEGVGDLPTTMARSLPEPVLAPRTDRRLCHARPRRDNPP